MSEQYWASRDGEIYNDGPYASIREACEVYAKHGHCKRWWVGRSETVTAQQLWSYDAERIVEQIGLDAIEMVGEVADDYAALSEPLLLAFQDEINEAIRRFLSVHGEDVEPAFFRIVDVHEYPKPFDKDCPCVGWCDQDAIFRIMTGHHDRCENAPKD